MEVAFSSLPEMGPIKISNYSKYSTNKQGKGRAWEMWLYFPILSDYPPSQHWTKQITKVVIIELDKQPASTWAQEPLATDLGANYTTDTFWQWLLFKIAQGDFSEPRNLNVTSDLPQI